MLFVTTGTTGFDAMVKLMDHLPPSLSEPVVLQIGNGRMTRKRESISAND